jgi:DNA-binding LacI/PurR family transcriptional regulator
MKNVTIQDIANEAQVSKSTVSRVLNSSSPVHPDKRRAILEVTQRLGFQPNPDLLRTRESFSRAWVSP